ncbi:unnamed protein product, partial [Rotaria magnacalcarata]
MEIARVFLWLTSNYYCLRKLKNDFRLFLFSVRSNLNKCELYGNQTINNLPNFDEMPI